MTQEEQDLLLRDLSARLTYGVKIRLRNTYNYHHENICKQGDFTIDEIKSIDKKGEHIKIYHNNPLDWAWYIDDIEIEDIKPYLRPMSSMTEDEVDHCNYLLFHMEDSLSYYDYLNSIHIDYRGLIPMGLAIEAPEGMYKI